MKKYLLTLVSAILFGVAMPTIAQQRTGNVKSAAKATQQVPQSAIKNPIVGSWSYDDQYGLELKLDEASKKGNFVFNKNVACHGGLAVSEYYEYFMILNMLAKKVISNTEVEYTVWGSDERKASKNVKGTIRLKKDGNRIKITGTESNGKKWPFDGFYLQSNQ